MISIEVIPAFDPIDFSIEKKIRGDAEIPCSGSVELYLMQGRVGEVALANDR